MTTAVIYTESQPGTLIYAFPKADSLANWLTARVQLIESASPNQGKWTGSLDDGEWAIFEGSTQPAGFHLSVYNYSITTDGAGSGARTVTITVTISGSPAEGATVRVTKAAESYITTTGVNGQASFNLDDGTWTVAITAANASFAGASLVVDGNESVTYAMTPAASIAASDPGKRTVYYTCFDNSGSAGANTTVYAKCIKAPGVGLALMGTIRSTTSDNAGLATFTNCIIGATYEFSMGSGRKVSATIPPGTSAIALESIVGQ